MAVEEGAQLQLDDIVALDRTLANGETVAMYGVVSQVRARHEGVRFDSDVFLVIAGLLPADTAEAAQVQVTRIVPETFVPPLPAAAVRKATDTERDAALDFEEVNHRLAAGLSREDEPIWIDMDFLDGTKGGHVNIAGISGVATKTSYATFLLYSLFTSGVLGAEGANTKGIIFNVKGEDLLFLDHPNTALDEKQRARYAHIGLEPAPFRSIGILAPPRPGGTSAVPNTGARQRGVKPLYWTIADFCDQHLLPFLFADAEDERQQYTIVVQSVTARLAEIARDSRAADGAIRIDDVPIRTFEKLVAAIERKLIPDDPDDRVDPHWTGRAIGGGTINAFIRRLASATRYIEPMVRADISDAEAHALDLDSHQLTVVDIHRLHDRAKRFVVGVVLRQAFEAKERSGVARPLQFIVLDELNKYAPRDGSSPIKEIILDLAERGRSLGIILIGAQQTASEVERRVVANSAIRVVGRLDTAEARREEYGFLPPVQRQRATILKPGSMYLVQPRLPIPLFIEFPFPAWATRSSEADPAQNPEAVSHPSDPFEGLAR